ncbi:MAG: LapA family protein [Desulfobacterales bacterium]|nr:MAG: LapA family protein [Desulfobacterales bacterium]
MKKLKMVFWLIVLGCIALLFFQNKEFFIEGKYRFHINLWFVNVPAENMPELPNAVTVLIFFFAGAILTYLLSMPEKFRSKRTLKKLNATMTSDRDEITKLRGEIDILRSEPATIPAEIALNPSEATAGKGDTDHDSPPDKPVEDSNAKKETD